MSEITRKPIMKRKPSGKFKKQWFQIEDLARLVEEDSSANWSEMGAMKTSTAEWLWESKLKHIPNPRVLVVTSKTGKGTYYESLPEVLPEWDTYTVGPRKFQIVIGGKPVRFDVKLPTPLHFRPVVVLAHYHCFTHKACQPYQKRDRETGMPIMNEETGTFEMVVPRCNTLMNYDWDMVICDEAHRMKNKDTQWTINLKKLRPTFKHIMTGTGFVNDPSEIWSLLNFLFPTVYTSSKKFRDYFCEIEDWSGYEKVVGVFPGREDEFRELVRRVGVRRTMLECFPNIKEPIVSVDKIELNPTQRRMYDDMLKTLQLLDQAGEPLHSPTVLSMLNRLRQICVATPKVMGEYYDDIAERRIFDVKLVEPSSKLDATMERIAGLEWDAERKDQIVIFSNFNDPLELLEERLKKANIPYVRLLASMNDDQRYRLWHDIWPQKEHQVFLSTLKLGSESINLTSAHRALFLDQDWSPVPNKQAIGRVYRPGQTEACQLIYVRAENTVDYRVLDANTTKENWFQQIFGEVSEDDDEAQTET